MKELSKEKLLDELEKAVGIKTVAYEQIKEMIKRGIPILRHHDRRQTLKKKPASQLPEKRGLTIDEIISTYPASVRILIVQLVAQIERLRKAPEPMIGKGWLPTAKNTNALPEPLRNYIAELATNADPPSMVADNIIMKDTIKTLEKMLEKLPEITEEWAGQKAKKIWDLIKQAQDEDLSDPALDLHYLGLSLDIVDSILEELGLKINKVTKRRGGCPPDFIPEED